MNDPEPLVRLLATYIRSVENLPTFNVKFYSVKERSPETCKYSSFLLGIGSTKIIRLHTKTNDILNAWPLETIKWFGRKSENFLYLDFGEYASQPYEAHTRDVDEIITTIDRNIGCFLLNVSFKKGYPSFGYYLINLFIPNL